MRLTLRTLIAFLDGTIPKDDAAALRKKIRESDAIRDLVSRIKRVIQQPQLLTPKTDGRGLAANANYCSEYLDGTLDVEQVPEFEKLAIGSDMLLAEIAEVHKILANLGDLDVGVSGRMRNRLYKQTEEIYHGHQEEPDVFPVVEDHDAIEEEYDDVPSKKRSTPPSFTLAPPKVDADESESLDLSAPPVVSPGKRLPVSDAPTPVTSRSRDKTERSKARKKRKRSIDSAAKDNADPMERMFESEEANESMNVLDASPPVIVPMGESPTSVRKSLPHDDSPQRARLVPVILATACITALICLIGASYLISDPDSQTVSQQDNGEPDQQTNNTDVEPETESGNNLDSHDQSDSAGTQTKDGTRQPSTEIGPTDSGTTDSGTQVPESTKGLVSEIVNKSNPIPGVNPTKQSGAPAEVPSKIDHGKAGQFEKLPEMKTNKPADAGEAEDEGIVNLFKDKDYEKKNTAANPSPDKSPDVNKEAESKAPEIAPERRMADPKAMMASAVALNNGPGVAVTKSSLEPCFRKTNLPEARWILVGQGQTLFVNDTLLSIQNSRPQFAIHDTVAIKTFGYGRATILPKDETKVLPKLNLVSGIYTLQNLKQPNTALDVVVNGKSYQFVFIDDSSEISVAVRTPAPETGLEPIFQVAATKGRALIKYGSQVHSLDAGQIVKPETNPVVIGRFAERPSAMAAKIDTLSETGKKHFFAVGLENPIATVAVDKLARDDRIYVKLFAMRVAFSMGDPQPYFEFLDDEKNRPFWKDAVFSIRQQIRENAEVFQRIKKLASTVGNPNHQLLLQLHLIVKPTDLENGGGQQLVDGLDAQSLMVRVGAIHSLYDITGKTKFFRPEDQVDKRRKYLRNWQTSLEKGEIQYSSQSQVDAFSVN